MRMIRAVLSRRERARRSLAALAVAVTVLLAFSETVSAQLLPLPLPSLTPTPTSGTPTGEASAVQATVLGVTTALADTGVLTGAGTLLEASLLEGSVPSVLTGDVLHAVAIGWPDQAASEAGLADLAVTLTGITISSDVVIASAESVLGAGSSGSALIDNLVINGAPVVVTGLPNQTIAIPGGQIVLNEQAPSAAGITVNAIHVTITGLVDLVIASASAGGF